jgi:hypothetical protein
MIPFEAKMRQGGDAAIREVSRFFDGTDAYHDALHSLARRLDNASVPYAIFGGAAIVAHGCWVATPRIEVIVPPEYADAVMQSVPLAVKVLKAGDFIDKYGRVVVPNPSEVSVEIDGVCYVRLESLIELKLASGMRDPYRLSDLADVQESIRATRPPRRLADRLKGHVRGKYLELWDGIASDDATS